MTADFHAVLASVRMRSAEYRDQRFVDDGCLLLWHSNTLDILDDMAVVDGVGLSLGDILGEYARKNLKRLGS
jgi:hypothetical protein